MRRCDLLTTDLGHALVVWDLTQIPTEGSGCRWGREGGAEGGYYKGSEGLMEGGRGGGITKGGRERYYKKGEMEGGYYK